MLSEIVSELHTERRSREAQATCTRRHIAAEEQNMLRLWEGIHYQQNPKQSSAHAQWRSTPASRQQNVIT
ncbi:hypothetical protein evm_015346 [Chilo suppressalis]|nr:hypothetical protein evm_015346 [Chilo suppressalis]